MTLAQAVTTAGSGRIDLTTTAGNLQVNAKVRAGGDLSLDAAGRLNIAATVRGSRVGLTGGTGIGHTAAGNVTSGGTLTATATANDINMAGTRYSAARAITLAAAKNVNLGRVEAGANPITVTAGIGAISDGLAGEGAGSENLIGNAISLTAGAGIGGPGGDADIDTAVTSIDAQTSTGGIFIASITLVREAHHS